ncbi:MAG: selenoprotein [Kangiellaceae bacterium]|jgi:selenoprotein W-related protein|nr:selenoprotein [Kangiellaceae bacterium]|tara:strand:- start:19158 stop:19463 length:306 start_codon:yes stop_codon:yes gene_type:complete
MKKVTITITFCTQCRWLMRAGWVAQELLVTFEENIAQVALEPGTGGIFRVCVDGEVIWDRKEQGRFPELRELKQAVRDIVDPDRSLGHSDSPVEVRYDTDE